MVDFHASTVGRRVYLDLTHWPAGTPEYLDVRANKHHTGPDGSLFLSWEEQHDAGLASLPGGQLARQVAVSIQHVRTLRGGMNPLWRYVETVTLPDEAPLTMDSGLAAQEPEWPRTEG